MRALVTVAGNPCVSTPDAAALEVFAEWWGVEPPIEYGEVYSD